MTQLLVFLFYVKFFDIEFVHCFIGVCVCWSLSVHKDAISKGWPLPWKASVGRGTPRFCRHPTILFAGTQQGKLASLQRLTTCSLLKFLCLCQTAAKEKKNDCCLKDPIGVPYCRSDTRQRFTAVICFLCLWCTPLPAFLPNGILREISVLSFLHLQGDSKQDQIDLDRSMSWSFISILGPTGSRDRPTWFNGVKGRPRGPGGIKGRSRGYKAVKE